MPIYHTTTYKLTKPITRLLHYRARQLPHLRSPPPSHRTHRLFQARRKLDETPPSFLRPTPSRLCPLQLVHGRHDANAVSSSCTELTWLHGRAGHGEYVERSVPVDQRERGGAAVPYSHASRYEWHGACDRDAGTVFELVEELGG